MVLINYSKRSMGKLHRALGKNGFKQRFSVDILLSSNALRKSFLHNSYITEPCCAHPPSSLFPFSFIKDVFVYSFFSDTSSCKACNTAYLEGYLYTPSELRNIPHITDNPTKPYIKQGKTASSFYFKSFHLIPFPPVHFLRYTP